MILPIYQPVGQSSHLLAQKAGLLYHQKATHTGTLDPMATGVLLVLTGKDRFRKKEYSAYRKTYEFEILLGVRTDSDDILGVIEDVVGDVVDDETGNVATSVAEDVARGVVGGVTKVKTNDQTAPTPTSAEKPIVPPNPKTITELLKTLEGKSTQKIHDFSAKRHNGNSYFDLAKAGTKPPNYSQAIEIFRIDFLSQKTILKTSLEKYIVEKLNKVRGDFRQEEIVMRWQDFFQKTKIDKFPILRFCAEVSKRTYIRSLVRDLGKLLNAQASLATTSSTKYLPITTLSITRVANGPYQIKDCVCLI